MRPWLVVVPLLVGLAAFTTLRAAAQPQGNGSALPPDVAVEVSLDLGAEPGKLQRILVTGMERALYPGMTVTQSLKVRNASSGHGAARATFTASLEPVAPLQAGNAGSEDLDPGGEGTLTWEEWVPATAEVAAYQNDITLTRDGIPFARLRLKQGAGEPIKLRSFSYVNDAGNDVNAYILFPGGTARLRFTVSNEGGSLLTVVGEVEAEGGLACTLDPGEVGLAAGASADFFLTCEAASNLNDANDRVTVRFRRG